MKMMIRDLDNTMVCRCLLVCARMRCGDRNKDKGPTFQDIVTGWHICMYVG